MEASSHKDRTVWYNQRATFPLRDAPPAALEKFWAQGRLDTAPDHHWRRAGPFNVAGRVTSLVIHPFDPNTLFAGTAAGGVWTSEDQGQSWSLCWGNFLSQNIGALAIQKIGKQFQLLAATGEANLSADSYPGSGLYSSIDGGISWRPHIRPPADRPPPVDKPVVLPRRIGAVVFDQNQGLAFGSVSLDESMVSGLYLTDHGHRLNACTFWGVRSYHCHSVLFHPANSDILYAAIEPRGADNGIWRTTNRGLTWDRLLTGVEYGRISLAIAPANPNILYALASNRARRLLGVFRSDNGGLTWKNTTEGQDWETRDDNVKPPRIEAAGTQLGYNNAIAVHPTDPDIAIWGGTQLVRTVDGGKTWNKITTSSSRTLPNYVHTDHHQILMPGGNLVYSANDGGVALSTDLGETWRDRSQGILNTQFYSLAVAASDSRIYGGGAQDNGSQLAGVDAGDNPAEGQFIHALPGDGGWMVIDPDDPQIIYGSAESFTIYRHVPGQPYEYSGSTWLEKTPKDMDQAERKLRGFAVLALQPVPGKGLKPLWGGTVRMWRSKDGGDTWEPKSPSFDNSFISAIACSRSNPQLLLVGTTKGGIFRSLDGGESWGQDLSTNVLPKRMITRIAIHPADPNQIALTIGSTGLRSAVLPRQGITPEEQRFSHVYYSMDGGMRWKDIDAEALPDVVFNAAVFETIAPNRLFVAGDTGVYVLQEGEWVNINGNLPNAVVSDIDYHEKSKLLTVATYGSGIWRIPVAVQFQKPAPPGPDSAPVLAGFLEDPALPVPELLQPAEGSVFSVFPRDTAANWHPVPGAGKYVVQVDILFSASSWSSQFYGTSTAAVTFGFGGAQQGRCRVFGLFSDSRRSKPSPWRNFRYTI